MVFSVAHGCSAVMTLANWHNGAEEAVTALTKQAASLADRLERGVP
jgi:hypothetical protein